MANQIRKYRTAKVNFLKNGTSFGYAYLAGQEGEVKMSDLSKMAKQGFVIPDNKKDLETAEKSFSNIEKRG